MHYDTVGEPQLLPITAIEQQVDGNHYCKLKIQPIQLAYSLNASPCFCKLAKYLTRDKDDKMIQYHKALHVIELEEELITINNSYGIKNTAGFGRGDTKSLVANRKIRDFSEQFDNDTLIRHALSSMYNKNYIKATRFVEKLIDKEEL